LTNFEERITAKDEFKNSLDFNSLVSRQETILPQRNNPDLFEIALEMT
jgi:hypothetical protein